MYMTDDERERGVVINMPTIIKAMKRISNKETMTKEYHFLGDSKQTVEYADSLLAEWQYVEFELDEWFYRIGVRPE
jgi:hypothetical protein